MSADEAQVLYYYGKRWLKEVKFLVKGAKADANRQAIVGEMNGLFNQAGLPVRVSRGWQYDDPVVRVRNRPHTYAALVAWATLQSDGGQGAAETFHGWYSGNTATLHDIGDQLVALAVITHFAEVARGYSHAVKYDLRYWIEDIANSEGVGATRALWRSCAERFCPALTSKQDDMTEWEANPQ